MKMDDLHAADNEDLREKLGRVGIPVPPLTDGRTTRQRETWVICRLLSTLATAGKLSYPLCLHHRDRPDFLVTCAGIGTGIETTEAVPKYAAKYFALAASEFPEAAVLEIPDFVFDGSSPNRKEMLRYLHQNMDRWQGSGWLGDEPERKWAEFVHGVIDHKLDRLKQDGFEKHRRNWLAVYDNLPLPIIDLQQAIDCLLPRFRKTWSNTPCFDVVFIEHGSSILQITAGGAERMTLDDLWEKQ